MSAYTSRQQALARIESAPEMGSIPEASPFTMRVSQSTVSMGSSSAPQQSVPLQQHFRKTRRKQMNPKKKTTPTATVPFVLSAFALAWSVCTILMVCEWRSFSVKDMAQQIPLDMRNDPSLLRPPIPSNIPLPLPQQKVSVVLMNYSRPRMIRDSTLMQVFLAHPNVDEVLLLHANPKTSFEYVHPKVVNIDATQHNDEMGLSLRFYFCQLAKNDWVIHVDDDVEFPTSTLNDMLIEFGRNSKRIVGRFGRDLVPNNSFEGYSSTNTHKTTEVILTKLMLMERNTCPAFFTYAHLIWDDVILYSGEGPLWNGEDIFMSLVANHVYKGKEQVYPKNNYAMDWLEVNPASDKLKDYDNGKLDISGGMAGLRFWDWQWWQSVLRRNRHYSYRGELWKTARQRLSDLPNDLHTLAVRTAEGSTKSSAKPSLATSSSTSADTLSSVQQ